MRRGESLKKLHKEQRETLVKRIDEAIHDMRANQITINKTTLAEELGITRRALYADHIKIALMRYPEFNPALSEKTETNENIQSLLNEIASLKAENKKLSEKNRVLRLECKAVKSELKDAKERYEHLLGKYQIDVGAKIVHF